MTSSAAPAGLLAERLDAILEKTATPGTALAAGSAAALTIALAAALASSAAQTIADPEESAGATTQAEALRLRAADLAGRNRDDYEAALTALRAAGSGHQDVRIGDALSSTLDTLALVSGTAADVCGLVAEIAPKIDAGVMADAASAVALAESAARVAGVLIEANLLGSVDSSDHELAVANLHAATAAREQISGGSAKS